MKEPTYLKEFDEDTFEKMFSQYLPVVYSMQSRYAIRDFDYDDWLQEGRIALNDAMNSYRQGRGTTFGLYYKMIFENRIRSLLRRQQAKKRLRSNKRSRLKKSEWKLLVNSFNIMDSWKKIFALASNCWRGKFHSPI